METKTTTATATKEKAVKTPKAAKEPKTPKAPKEAKPVRNKRLTLSDINASLYGSGKTTQITPVGKTDGKWSTSSSVNSNDAVILFSKTAGIISVTTNGENPVTIKTKNDLDAFIGAL